MNVTVFAFGSIGFDCLEYPKRLIMDFIEALCDGM